MSRGHAPDESSDRDVQSVLLVEDHSDIRRVLRVSLESEGYSVIEASSGPEGIDRVEASHPNLVILDLMLPVKDGWWFLREVQRCPAPRPVVMVLSARAGQGERLVAQNLGAAAFMVKPFEPDEVVTKVQSLIGTTENERRGAV
jgi:DNA-binding response OmpR family regulator